MIEDVTYPESLEPFIAEGLISEVLREVKSGKEGTVYCCRTVPTTGKELVAAKVYRPRHRRSFHNDAVYYEGRYTGKRREALAVEKKTRKGRVMQAGIWVNHEVEVLRLLGSAGADVPEVVAAADSAVLLEYFGDVETAAPLLVHTDLSKGEARHHFERIMRNVELMLRYDVVHGDLSAYNVLDWEGRLVIIDFPQAVDARFNPSAFHLLQRDIGNICQYFARYGVLSDPSRIASFLWGKYVRAEL